MRSPWRATTASVVTIGVIVVAGCSSVADVASDELSAVVERDGVVFDIPSIPSGVRDVLAEQRVVLLGETHHLREHWAFVATLMGDLHDNGFRQLLIEAPHMAGWLLDDYVQGGPMVPEWEAPPSTNGGFRRSGYSTRPSLQKNVSMFEGSTPTRSGMEVPATSSCCSVG